MNRRSHEMKSLAVEITRYEVTDRDGVQSSLPGSAGTLEKDRDGDSVEERVKVESGPVSVYTSDDMGVAV